MTKEEAVKLIAEKIAQSEAILREATAIADEHDLEFSIDGPSYGMGGYYIPKTMAEEEDCYDEDTCTFTDTGGCWMSSSSSC